MGMGYHRSLLFRYLDTFPRPDGRSRVAGAAARPDARADRRGDRAPATTPYGTPDEVEVAIQQVRRRRRRPGRVRPAVVDDGPRPRGRDDRDVRQARAAAVRQRPRHRTTRQREAATCVSRPRSRRLTQNAGVTTPTFNLADLWETLCDAGPDAECLVARAGAAHARLARRAPRTRSRHELRRVRRSSRVTASASTPATGPSTSRRCSGAGSAARSRSTSTGATSPAELRYVIDDAELVAMIVEDEYLPVLDELGFERRILHRRVARRGRRRARSTTCRARPTTCTCSTRAARPACRRA